MTNSLEAKCYEPTQPQKSIILTDKFYNNKHISVIAGWCRINEPVNFDNLELAINKLVENNDAYRIVFTKDENGMIMVKPECKNPIILTNIGKQNKWLRNLEDDMKLIIPYIDDRNVTDIAIGHGGELIV